MPHPLQGRASFFPQIVHMLSASFVRVFRASYSRFFLISSGSMISSHARRRRSLFNHFTRLSTLGLRKGKIAQNLTPGLSPRLERRVRVVLHAPLGVVLLAPGRRRVEERQAPDREGRRGEERGDDEAKAKHDSPARKRSISGSGDDAA